MTFNTKINKNTIYSWKEIRMHNTVSDCWVVYNGNVYDITSFVNHHPGGSHTLSTAAGQDITYLMHTSHTFVDYPFELLKKYHIGKVDKDFVTYDIDNQPFYQEITTKVRNYFKQNPSLDSKDASFTFKVFFGILFFYLLGFYYFFTTASYWSVIMIGITRSLFGIHTMHACSHFSVTHNPKVWKYLNWFCFDILMGSSHWAWDYQHVIGHHQHTNVFQADPDLPMIKKGDMRYLVEKGQQWSKLYQYQHLYLPFLYLFLAIKVHVYDMMYLFGYKMNGAIEMNQSTAKYCSLLATKMFWYFYNFYVPIVWFNMSLLQFLKLFLVMEIASGGYLAYVFQVNHISEQVQYTQRFNKKSTKAKRMGYFTSRRFS